MNSSSVGIITFALIALSAVFAFLLVFGGPIEETGDQVCSEVYCTDGSAAMPTGDYDFDTNSHACACPEGIRYWKNA